MKMVLGLVKQELRKTKTEKNQVEFGTTTQVM